MKKVLFLGADSADYLNVSILNGLLENPSVDLFMYPQSNLLFENNKERYSQTVRGGGFSIFFTNKKQKKITEHDLQSKIDNSYFDLVIIGDIFASYPFYLWVEKFAIQFPSKIIILDGADSQNIFPYAGSMLWSKSKFFYARVHKRHKYFKRELTNLSKKSMFYMLAPNFLLDKLNLHKNLRKISFGFPAQKITDFTLLKKEKIFTKHIVDEEIAGIIDGSVSSYAFASEESYYEDIQKSRFGITTKRSGWDCLRHYEIAANGAVICFKDLDKKPASCAPHDLVPSKNCLSYRNYSDLMHQINLLSEADYQELLNQTYAWIQSKNSKNIADLFLKEAIND